MASNTTTATPTTSRSRQRPSTLTITASSPFQPEPEPESRTKDDDLHCLTPPPTPSLTHPRDMPSAIHLLHLRITHLGAGYLSEIASSVDPHRTLQLSRFFADGMREYVSDVETLARGTAYEGLGLRMLRDAVLRGRTPHVQWLDVGPANRIRRKQMMRAVEVWWDGQREGKWRGHFECRRRQAVQQVERETEGKRADGMRKVCLLAGLQGDELGWRMWCWEFDIDAERDSKQGVKNLEEEFREIGEWPEGCGPDDDEEDGDG
ncbi:uncharacterized protein CC84DRAFT_1211013 [Paraphaeosphaeria sporulosa]|uniref:Uncharacterized protein n=1 Tax=Paraphaeosphaeria sporulosa TaxID=1460663 RepID=A0A177CWS1_9PLEO|nr:uncharacterized protein CC84DRAFT_1211013 [Paraphaeosphaeria sporulosa]OAG11352.1 hypothetical protein CC84DRAFT_1211013 [Paraphaeosphaeria sporulosa]